MVCDPAPLQFGVLAQHTAMLSSNTWFVAGAAMPMFTLVFGQTLNTLGGSLTNVDAFLHQVSQGGISSCGCVRQFLPSCHSD